MYRFSPGKPCPGESSEITSHQPCLRLSGVGGASSFIGCQSGPPSILCHYMKSILPLKDLRAVDRVRVGGKAAILGELFAAGMTVPSGFVVLDDATDEGVLAAFDQLSSPLVAVRSSAIAEDGAKQSWAGTLQTFLRVDRATVLARIADCRASGQGKRAQSYGNSAGKVAVIVQTMLPSEISGVLFSVDPVSGDTNRLLIEASRGVGESVVSGSVIPEHIVVDTSSGAIVEKQNSGQAVLTANQVKDLVAAAVRVEQVLHAPVDIEWSCAAGRLYLLQARPITTL